MALTLIPSVSPAVPVAGTLTFDSFGPAASKAAIWMSFVVGQHTGAEFEVVMHPDRHRVPLGIECLRDGGEQTPSNESASLDPWNTFCTPAESSAPPLNRRNAWTTSSPPLLPCQAAIECPAALIASRGVIVEPDGPDSATRLSR